MSAARESLALPAGSPVGAYRLESVRAAWGFYLTYQAREAGSGRAVAVHELLPEELVTRAEGGAVHARSADLEKDLAWARDRFLREGRGLAACAHPSLQRILEVVEANGTVYWVTPPDEPRHVKAWLQELGHPVTELELRRILEPLLAGLEVAHKAGWHHLNVKPESIQMTADGQPVLTHFAGARQAIARQCHEAAAVTTGYSAPEQYDLAKAEGAWTDIYSLAAVMHRAICGKAPPDAEHRLGSDPYERLAGRYAGQYRAAFLTAIDAALAPDPVARPQNIQGWRRMLGISSSGSVIDSARRRPLGVLAGACALGVALWFLFRPPHGPDHPLKDQTASTEETKEQDQTDDKKNPQDDKTKTEAEEKEKKAAEEKEQLLAEQKAQEAEKEAAAKAAQEKQAADEAARLAREAAEAATKAESAKLAAEEAARKAREESAAAEKAAAEKAAAQAAAEAAATKAAAEQAARMAEEARRAAEKAAQATKNAEQEAAAMIARLEEEKRKTAERVSKTPPSTPPGKEKSPEKMAQAEAEKRAAEQARQEKIAAEKAAEEMRATEKAVAEKAAAEKRAADLARQEKIAAEKAAEEKRAAEKAASEKAEAEKKAAQARGDPNQGKYKASTSEGSSPDGDAKGTTAVGSSGTGIPGVWETTAVDAQGRPKRRLIIYDDGRYQISDNENWKDSGIILAKMGRIQMKSDTTGDVVRSSFKLRSLSKIVTSGALGEDEWKRVSASPGNDPNAPKKQ